MTAFVEHTFRHGQELRILGQRSATNQGIKLPEGLQECQKLPEVLFTPSTKAEIGDHDENISVERSIEVLEKLYPGRGKEYALKIRDYTIAIYKKCADYALSRGIIIADTKFEFGLDENGEVVLGDEYDVVMAQAEKDCEAIIAQWQKEGLV